MRAGTTFPPQLRGESQVGEGWSVEAQTQITRKDLDFIDDSNLRANMLERLYELDRVFTANANYSSVFLAMGCVEGIFRHIGKVFKSEVRSSSNYPKTKKGKPKRFRNVTINEFYLILRDLGITPNISDFEKVYSLFRDYRNFIHPQAQARKDWPIALDQAQMALGLLNATIDHLSQYIFIGKNRFRKIAGNPNLDSSGVLNLNLHKTRLHSFLVLENNVKTALSLAFDLELPRKSIFNFVFNYKDDGNFKMLRLDNRREKRTPNYILHCTQKYFWTPTLKIDPEFPPDKDHMTVKIEIDLPHKLFSFEVDGQKYAVTSMDGKSKELFDQIKPNMKIGFFNEVVTVKLSNIRLKTP